MLIMGSPYRKALLLARLLFVCYCNHTIAAFQITSSERYCLKNTTQQSKRHSSPLIRSSMNCNEDTSASEENHHNEELLMNISCKVKLEHSKQDVLDSLQSYLVSFPFAALLPVQPLTWELKSDNSGLALKFLRK